MTEASTDGQWYIARDGKQHGPLSDEEMRLFVEGGHLKPADLVWRPGFSDWRPAHAIFPPAAKERPVEPSEARTEEKSANAEITANADAASTAQSETLSPIAARQGETQSRTAGRAADHGRNSRVDHDGTQDPATGSPTSGSPSTRTADAIAQAPVKKEPRKSNIGRNVAIAALLAVIATGGWLAYQLRDHIADLARAASSATQQPIGSRAGTEQKVASLETKAPPVVEQAVRAEPPAAKTGKMAFDPRQSNSPLWKLLQREFPDWYADQVENVETQAGNTPDSEVTKKLIAALVALRRKHAESALAADSSKLIAIASTFLANLKSLSDHSTDACYQFISHGENHPNILSLMQTPKHADLVEIQIAAVFDAVADGRTTPQSRERPGKNDYALLARQLGSLGWGQEDQKLFSNPRELAKAPPGRVCQMVKDWFTAHLAINDSTAQDRLLYETLRLVVAG